MAVEQPEEQSEELEAPAEQPQAITPDGTEASPNLDNINESVEDVEGTTKLPNGGWEPNMFEPNTWQDQKL